ncbi:MAG: hypothetical protein AB8B97_20240 [Granulosicoccus sp.]
MIYLISQMILALAVAVVLGMALGWLIHRTTYNQKTHSLKQTLARQTAGLAQAQSEVSMLAEDYDEMQRQLQDQLAALREENRQIPSLNSNLEKSQLLVKQMMQRHETKVRELTNENRKLSSTLARIGEQEQTRNQLAAGLDKRRRESARDDAQPEKEQPPVEQSADNQGEPPESPETPSVNSGNRSVNSSSTANVTPIRSTGNPEDTIAKPQKPARFAAAESDADPFDQVIEVEDDLQRELDMTAERKLAALEMDASLDVSEPEPGLSVVENNDLLKLTSPSLSPGDPSDNLNLTTVQLNADERDLTLSLTDLTDLSLNDNDDSEDLDNLIALEDVGEFNDTLATDANDTLSQTSDLDNTDATLEPSGRTPETAADLNNGLGADSQAVVTANDQLADTDALQLDGSGDNSVLFGQVNQHDDLQQIFGIGPLTEKALNELGITSYSQLAELQQHEIQRIADALEIGPGRIERDNWVGNARRQLEEVLEQL